MNMNTEAHVKGSSIFFLYFLFIYAEMSIELTND